MAKPQFSALESAPPVPIYIAPTDVECDVNEFGADSWFNRDGWYLIDENTGRPLLGPCATFARLFN